MMHASLLLKGHRDGNMWTVNIDNHPTTTHVRVQATRLQVNNVYEYKKKQGIVTYLPKAV